jgi:hypothetical protein
MKSEVFADREIFIQAEFLRHIAHFALDGDGVGMMSSRGSPCPHPV